MKSFVMRLGALLVLLLAWACSMPSNEQEVPQIGEWTGSSGDMSLTADSLGWGGFFGTDTVFWWLDGKYCYSLRLDEKEMIDYEHVMSGTIQGRGGMLLYYIEQSDSWTCDVEGDSLLVEYRDVEYRFSRASGAAVEF